MKLLLRLMIREIKAIKDSLLVTIKMNLTSRIILKPTKRHLHLISIKLPIKKLRVGAIVLDPKQLTPRIVISIIFIIDFLLNQT